MMNLSSTRASYKRKRKYDYQPSIGVKTDFETLLQQFSSFGTVRYEKFAECWKALNMSCYCAGRQSQREAREFVEDCFLIASQYWLPPSSFLIRAGALYLLYGLYYYQLVIPKVKIRITQQQWPKILEFQQEAKEQQHHDLDFIFHKMLLEKAFVFVASEDDMYPKDKDVLATKLIPESMKDETGLLDEVFSNSAINQLSMVHDQYKKMKRALTSSDTGQPDTSLNIAHSDLIESINKTLETHKERQKTISRRLSQNPAPGGSSDVEDIVEPEEPMSVKKLLKQKAFEQGISGPRKRTKTEEVEENSWNIDMSQKVIQSHGRRAIGNKYVVGLYDKDETEDAPLVVPQVQELFCMPDVEDGVSVPVKSLGSASEETSDDYPQVDTVSEEQESDFPSVSKIKGKRKPQSKNVEGFEAKRKKTSGDTDDDSASFMTPKKLKDFETSSGKDLKSSESISASTKNVKGSSKKTVAKKSVKSVSENTDDSNNKVKEITAQERLHMKLNQKKKEARLKSTQKRKPATKSKGSKKMKK